MADYEIRTDVKFGPLERIDVTEIAASVTPWFNQTLCRVNDAVIRLGVIEGEFHWHKHEMDDEFFYVVEGNLLVDVEDGATADLKPGQGFVVPAEKVHRTRAPVRTVILMAETADVRPTGD
jgi:mannose-6-phosphate isomerase-like protein (cupin superfamily)